MSPRRERCEEPMSSTLDILRNICSELLTLDEDEVLSCLPVFHKRLESFNTIEEWEEATLMFFLINGIRIKNIQMPEKLAHLESQKRKDAEKMMPAGKAGPAKGAPSLTLVK